MEWRERIKKRANKLKGDEYRVLHLVIGDRADSAKECKEMIENIASHINAEKNWDELSDKEQACLIIWEQEMDAVSNEKEM